MEYLKMTKAEAKHYLSVYNSLPCMSDSKRYPHKAGKIVHIRGDEVYFLNHASSGDLLNILAVACYGGKNYTYSYLGREIE